MTVKDALELIPDRYPKVVILKTLKTVDVFERGNFTVALLKDKNSNWGVGISKRNPIDKQADIGLRIAIARAVKDYGFKAQRKGS